MLTDWIQAFSPLTSRGTWHWTRAGKLKMTNPAQPHDTPWVLADERIPGIDETGLDCGIFHNFHEYVVHKKTVHSFCMDCYKIVVVPKDKIQVHKIAGWQNELGWSCKVGAEVRPYVKDRLWGAYFYCRGVEEGREKYKIVRKWVDENLGEDVRVFLKRGCTEFEQNMGDSDKWQLLPRQEELEKEYREIIDYDPMQFPQAPAIKHHVWDMWDDWEKKNRSPVTYHEEEK